MGVVCVLKNQMSKIFKLLDLIVVFFLGRANALVFLRLNLLKSAVSASSAYLIPLPVHPLAQARYLTSWEVTPEVNLFSQRGIKLTDHIIFHFQTAHQIAIKAGWNFFESDDVKSVFIDYTQFLVITYFR